MCCDVFIRPSVIFVFPPFLFYFTLSLRLICHAIEVLSRMCNPLFEGVFIEKFLASFTEFLFRILRVRFNETCKTTPYNVRGLCLPSTDQLRRGFISCLIPLSSKFVLLFSRLKFTSNSARISPLAAQVTPQSKVVAISDR